ncbi:hypothetical protein [Pontibacter sp. SGAir0037]|uniref:hypothetical protein n=1 Tax=Pontibacter sp. SGAir0037 TaxID=2571030 RepID=UPI00143DE516|nr:hypothetical protein [Pontibacter sp. SGAir0037]
MELPDVRHRVLTEGKAMASEKMVQQQWPENKKLIKPVKREEAGKILMSDI